MADQRPAAGTDAHQQSDFATAFRQRVLYFLDRSGTVVVPDVRHVVIGQTPANRANRLISMLIGGPSSQLRRRGADPSSPRESALRSNPSVDPDGVLQVDLTGVDVSTPEARRALAAQIVWTLSPTSPRIAITVDGEPLDPAQQVYTINSVSSFDPDRLAGTGQVASDPYFVTPDGRDRRADRRAADARRARHRHPAGARRAPCPRRPVRSRP